MMSKQDSGVGGHAIHSVVVRMARRGPTVVDTQPPFQEPAVREKGGKKKNGADQENGCEHFSLHSFAIKAYSGITRLV
jgi:hypothetical protein